MSSPHGGDATPRVPLYQEADLVLAQPALGEVTLAPVQRIEQLDEWAINLLSGRLGMALTADAVKDSRGLPVLAAKREAQVLDRVLEINTDEGDPLDRATLITLYRGIMSLTRTEQLKARLARGTISLDELDILQKVTGKTNNTLREEAQLVKPASDLADTEKDDLLASSRSQIDTLDERLVRLWMERQQLLLANRLTVLVEPALMRVADINRKLDPHLDAIELYGVFERLFRSMKLRQAEATPTQRNAATRFLAALAVDAASDGNRRPKS